MVFSFYFNHYKLEKFLYYEFRLNQLFFQSKYWNSINSQMGSTNPITLMRDMFQVTAHCLSLLPLNRMQVFNNPKGL